MSFRSSTIVLGASALLLAACSDTSSPVETGPVRPTLVSQTVHRVVLTEPRRIRSSGGETSEIPEAFFVLLEIENLPAALGPRMALYAGDQEIREYGGWQKGIYFKVYEESDLRGLIGQPLRYRLSGEDIAEFGATLPNVDPATLPRTDEREFRQGLRER